MGVGVSSPQEKLDVDGAIRIKSTSGNLAGTIRYNPTTNKFEGRDDVSWKEFGGSGTDDWTKVGEPAGSTDTDAIFHSGNVGIGTTIPLTKLHVKGLGSIAIKAETANDSDTMSAIHAINTIGVAIRAKSTSDTLPTIYTINMDSSGYALMAINKAAIDTVSGDVVVIEGGNAALFLGDINAQGAIRNSNDDLYGGSVAINDGLTVGTISGADCIPVTDTSGSFTKDFGTAGELVIGTNGPNYDFTTIPHLYGTGKLGDCRVVTDYYIEFTVVEVDYLGINCAVNNRGQYIATVIEPSGKLDNYLPLPGNYPGSTDGLVSWAYDALYDAYVSTWAFSKVNNNNCDNWNNTDPYGINWFVSFDEYAGDGDVLLEFSGKIKYKYADSTSAPAYATFGQVRASGSLFANSTNEYGDVAEFFKVKESSRKPEFGDIVSVSTKDNQTFELTNKPYDPLCAGVISENPSVFINDPSAGEPVALTGRVKVKVNLQGGKIMPGDPITSSSMEGVGMKANADGLILGYAMEGFDGSRAEVGKVWILLAKGHVEKVSPFMQVHQVEGKELSGMEVSGSTKVKPGETEVFIAWNAQVAGHIPADVEFDDLFVALTPFGGKAELIVKSVNEKGFTVEISDKSASFEGFYYKLDILSGIEEEPTETPAAKTFATTDEQVAYAKEIYTEWTSTFRQLEEAGGMSFDKIKTMKSAKEIMDYKKKISENWKKNHAELFAKYQSLGKELSAVVGNNQDIMRQLQGN